jgi:hypothetical protein
MSRRKADLVKAWTDEGLSGLGDSAPPTTDLRHHAERESVRQEVPPQAPASEAGGRVGVDPGLPRRPPSSESHRWRPLLVPPRSLEPYPSRPSNEPHCLCRRASAQDCTGTVRPIRQPSRRRRARRTLGRRGAGLPGACPTPPASPGSRGCRRRSASARWRLLIASLSWSRK